MGNKSIWIARSFRPGTGYRQYPDLTLLAKIDSGTDEPHIPAYTGLYYDKVTGPAKKDLQPVRTWQVSELGVADNALSLTL